MDIVHYIYIRGGMIGMILDRDLRSHIMSVADFTFGVDRIGWIHTIKDRYDTNARSFPCYGDAMKHVHDQMPVAESSNTSSKSSITATCAGSPIQTNFNPNLPLPATGLSVNKQRDS